MPEIDPNTPGTADQQPETIVEPTEVERVVVVARPRKVYAGMWGIPEIAAVSVASLVLLLAIVIYAFWVVPSNRDLARKKADAEKLDADVASARSKYGDITNSQTQVNKLVTSVDDFESRYLPVVSTGETALYQKLNSLIAAYDLVNTNGPSYAPLEAADVSKPAQQQSDDEKGRAKFKSLYPGVYVSTTLEGSYQNLRKFIRDIETGRDFIIVSSVELAPSDTDKKGDDAENKAKEQAPQELTRTPPNMSRVPNGAGPAPGVQNNSRGFGPGPNIGIPNRPQPRSARLESKTRGEVVTLHIELAAYFRRPNAGAAQQ